MPIIKNGKNISAIFKGSIPVVKVYKGLQVVWEAFKELILSGIPPLKFNSNGDDLIDYKVYGNSKQDDIPNTKFPVEINSVGDKTNNLLNVAEGLNEALVDNGDGTYTLTKKPNDVRQSNIIYVHIPANTPFYVKAKVLEYTGTYSQKFQMTIELADGSTKYFNVSENSVSRLCQYTSDVVKFKIYSDRSNPDGAITKFKDLMVTYNADDEYEPFGYRIPATVRSTNLFDVYAWYPEFVDEHGNLRYTNNDYMVIYRKKILEGQYKENTQYIFSVKYELIKKATINFGVLLHMILSDGTSVVKRLPDKDVAGTYTGACSVTNPVGTTVSKISLSYNSQDYPAEVLLWDMQIEEGATPTEYSPYVEPTTTNIYLDEPLKQVGEYKDYIDYKNQKVVRNIYSYVATGNENFYLCDSNAIRTDYNVVPEIMLKSGSPVLMGYLCSHVPSAINYTYITTYSMSDPTILEFRNIVANWGIEEYTVEAWTTFLKYEYQNYKPLTINFVLATPQEQSISLSSIKTIKGNNTLEVNTQTQPSNVELVYKGKQ